MEIVPDHSETPAFLQYSISMYLTQFLSELILSDCRLVSDRSSKPLKLKQKCMRRYVSKFLLVVAVKNILPCNAFF